MPKAIILIIECPGRRRVKSIVLMRPNRPSLEDRRPGSPFPMRKEGGSGQRGEDVRRDKMGVGMIRLNVVGEYIELLIPDLGRAMA